MAQSSGVPFPLGVMVGGPNGSDPAAEAVIAAQYSRFVGLMGAAPQFMDGFVDAAKPIAQWASNAAWTAWSWRQSSTGQNVTPVIGLPMATNADTGRRAAVYQEFASGLHDKELRGVVEAWRDQGYSTLYLRPGYEMNGDFTPWYAGADAATRSAWVAAFQRIATVARSVPGADVKIVWNPNIQAGNTANVQGLYPGDQYVDVIAGDLYSPMYPRSLYNWALDDGTVDPTFEVWASNPINRMHYWSYPAANQWNPVSDGQSNTFSLLDLIAFAKAHNKPLGIAETGVGGDGTRGPMDDPAFPEWLAKTLQSSGVPIAFVNIWNLDPGDGNWDFTSPGSNKPLTAAAWAKYFGVPAQPANAIGSGPDLITVQLSQDAYAGDAQCIITVDGKQVGGVQTVTASHAAGQHQVISVLGTFGTGAHAVAVTFLNDAYGGSGLDRNLYLDSVALRGTTIQAKLGLYSNGTQTVTLPATAATSADTLVLRMSQDAYGAPAQFIVRLDGVQLTAAGSVTARHGVDTPQAFTFTGPFGTGAHRLTVSFLNDDYGGSPGLDRNLYVDGVTFNGAVVPGKIALYSNGLASLDIPAAATADTLVFSLSEDAWNGDAQCLLLLDGKQLGGVQTVTASHALGVPQAMTFKGSFGPGAHTASVQFLNDAYGGTGLDRNLFVHAVELNGVRAPGTGAALWSNGTANFALPAAAASVPALLDGTQAAMVLPGSTFA